MNCGKALVTLKTPKHRHKKYIQKQKQWFYQKCIKSSSLHSLAFVWMTLYIMKTEHKMWHKTMKLCWVYHIFISLQAIKYTSIFGQYCILIQAKNTAKKLESAPPAQIVGTKDTATWRARWTISETFWILSGMWYFIFQAVWSFSEFMVLQGGLCLQYHTTENTIEASNWQGKTDGNNTNFSRGGKQHQRRGQKWICHSLFLFFCSYSYFSSW